MALIMVSIMQLTCDEWLLSGGRWRMFGRNDTRLEIEIDIRGFQQIIGEFDVNFCCHRMILG